jgi:hypothetical protein
MIGWAAAQHILAASAADHDILQPRRRLWQQLNPNHALCLAGNQHQ